MPGVGHFGATRALDGEWVEAILARVGDGRPLLGICLGMQWLFEGSDEAPDCPGLGLLAGPCYRLQRDVGRGRVKVPHVGWNSARACGATASIVDGVAAGAQVYFTHSYVAPVTGDTVAATEHGEPFAVGRRSAATSPACSFIRRSRATSGLQILANFLRLPTELGSAFRCCPNASSPASTSATARSSRASTSKGCAAPAIPAELARRYNAEGIDELVILDITATLEARRALADTIRAVARELFIPLAVGGGIRTEDDAAAAVEAGADKVSLNTAALVESGADHDARRPLRQPGGRRRDRREARRRAASPSTRAAARRAADRDAVEWAREAETRGAGEILLTSIDRDGTKAGFDCEMTAAVSRAVSIPVIASGGAGALDHFVDVFTDGPRRRRARRVDLSLRRNQRARAEAAPAATTAFRCAYDHEARSTDLLRFVFRARSTC